MSYSPAFKVSLAFLAVALACLAMADIAVTTIDPWGELGRMLAGLFAPQFSNLPAVGVALAMTVAFALSGVALGALAGFGLSLVFHRSWLVRSGCAFVRAIHELFWALLFLQGLGLNAVTGVLAIAVPYAGTFAKVYAEIMEEADRTPEKALPAGTRLLPAFFYTRLPGVWAHLRSYTSYRLECGLRSSAVLGFIGLPTLGFHLDAFFSNGYYGEVWALLILFYLIIATLRLWMRPRLLPLWLVAALVVLWQPVEIVWSNVWRFLSSDIVPAPLREGGLADPGTMSALGSWAGEVMGGQALPGAFNTVILTQIALVGTGACTLLFFPLVSRQFLGPVGRTAGHVFLVVMRSTPEYILAYIFLQLWGPSMLPAIVALALHNGAIIGHLTGRHADHIRLRPDAPGGLNRYGYEILPRVYGQFLAFLFYRWEVIMRETAILGILGIHTLGFYVDSAIAEFRLDRAAFLILLTALLNIGVDALARNIRARLRLSTTAQVQ